MDNSIPALERALDVLEVVFTHPNGVGAARIASLTGVPRTTLYRILRVLSAKGYLAADANGYVLGHALTRIGVRTTRGTDLVTVARPVMESLAHKVGETVKLVLREGSESFTAAVHVPCDDRVASQQGARIPLHVGASQRLLLSRAPPKLLARILAGPLERFGPGSITNSERLRRNLAELATRDWEFGQDEGIQGVGTVGALIPEPDRVPRAAIAIVFIVKGKSERDLLRFRAAAREAARSVASARGV